MSYRIESATREEWAARCKVAEDRVAELDLALRKTTGALGDIHNGEPEWPEDDTMELAWCRNRAMEAVESLKDNT
jgi:hypothetical protein